MSTKPEGWNDAAFPRPRDDGEYGMNLEDYFAAQAMNGLLCVGHPGPEFPMEAVAELAYRMADAMLAKREASK